MANIGCRIYTEIPRPSKELVQRFLDTACANRELLVSLIERVELTEDREIIIRFRFAELQQAG